jgi:NAD(P)-dependent dehydrogenase (short-subunit alcohol dehydrogenase family)
MASLGGFPRMLAYCASKAGVNALLEGLRAEVGPHGIAVTTICPGWIRTPMTASIEGKLDFLMELEEAARRIHAAIRAKAPRLIFPRRLGWRLRLLACLPTAWRDRIVMKMARRLQTAPRAPGSSQL